MNKKIFGRILAWALTLAVLLTSGAMGTVNTAFAANKKVTKVTVTAKAVATTLFREDVKITKSLLKKTLKFGYTYKVGKKTKKVSSYTGFSSPQIGKKVTVGKNGKMKITVKAFNKKASISLKVNKMTGISVSECYLTLVEDEKFSSEAFKGSSKVEAFFQKGSTLEISSYKVTVPSSTVKADKDGYFRVTVSRNGFSDTIAVKVIKPGQEPTTAPSVEPSQVPATATPSAIASATPSVSPSVSPSAKPSVSPSVSPSATPTAKPTQKPGGNNNGGGDIIIINPPAETCRPTQKPTEKPSASPTPTSTEPTVTPTPEYTLTVLSAHSTIKLNGRNMQFSNNSASSTVQSGTTVNLSVTDSSDARFVRWINSNTGEEISTSMDIEVTMTSDISIMAIFQEVYNVTVKLSGGKGKVEVDGNDIDFYGGEKTVKLTPGRRTFTVIPADGYKFVGCKDVNGKLVSSSNKFEIPIPGDSVYELFFAEEDKTVNVTYKHEDGTVFKTDAVAFGGTLAAPINNVWREDYTFVAWKIGNVEFKGDYKDSEFFADDNTTLSSAIKELTRNKQDVTIVACYVEEVPDEYTLTIEGGTFSSPTSVAGLTTGNFIPKTYVIIVATDVPGKNFAGWKDENGSIKSQDQTYPFYTGKANSTLTATWSDNVVESIPIVTLDSYELNSAEEIISFKLSSRVPENYDKVKWGILVSNETNADGTLKTTGSNIVFTSGNVPATGVRDKAVSKNATDKNVDGTTYNLVMPASFFDSNSPIEVRAYMYVSSTKGEEYIYSTNTFPITLSR